MCEGALRARVQSPCAAAVHSAAAMLLRTLAHGCFVVQPSPARSLPGRFLSQLLTPPAPLRPLPTHPHPLQRLWHRNVLQLLLGWLAPHLDPERELEHQAAAAAGGAAAGGAPASAAAAAASELLGSPLCSPRAATQPRSPTFSPGGPGGPAAFDAAELYAAVKPTGREPELPAGTTSSLLLPTLRRYQVRLAQRGAAWRSVAQRAVALGSAAEAAGLPHCCSPTLAALLCSPSCHACPIPWTTAVQARAAQWMVDREKGLAAGSEAVGAAQAGAAAGAVIREERCNGQDTKQEPQAAQPEAGVARPLHPLWREVPCSSSAAGGARSGAEHGDNPGSPGWRCFYVNPYNGQISLERFDAEPEARGQQSDRQPWQ